MALRKVYLKQGNTSMLLPVTPSEFSVEYGQAVSMVNLTGMGDVALPTHPECGVYTLDVLLPAQKYSVNNRGAETKPETYISQLKGWMTDRKVVQYIISDTSINKRVYITGLTHTEKDGTNDVYLTITMQEYREPKIIQKNPATKPAGTSGSSSGTASKSASKRPAVLKGPKTTINYKIKRGDTLSAICKKHYGDSSKSMYTKVAKYNKIKNPDLIITGKTIKLPPRDKL